MIAGLSDLMRQIAVVPNRASLDRTFATFQACFSEELASESPFRDLVITHELTRRFLLAGARLRRMGEVPESLQLLMHRIQRAFQQGLQINSVVALNLRSVAGEEGLELSCIDKYLSVVALRDSGITYSDLYELLESDWGINSSESIQGKTRNLPHTIMTYFSLIVSSIELEGSLQHKLWKNCQLDRQIRALTNNLKMAAKGTLQLPGVERLEALKAARETLYLPVGSISSLLCFMSLAAIDYHNDGYRLRLLISDGRPILAAGKKEDHFCPEVVWEGLKVEQLTDSSLWRPILEMAKMPTSELEINLECGLKVHRAFISIHFIPWFTQRLGKGPQRGQVEIEDKKWDQLLDSEFKGWTQVIPEIKKYDDANEGAPQNLLLMPTGKEIKNTLTVAYLRKFIHLLPLDLLPTRNDFLLFKAESRLILLTGAFVTLQKGSLTPLIRGNFLRLIEQAYGKITAPLEKVMELNPSKQEQEVARSLMVSLVDLKHRIIDLVRTMDRIPLLAPPSHYPAPRAAHRIELSSLSRRPIESVLLDSLRLNEGLAPLPYCEQWTASRFPELFNSLEQWYGLLLDAKKKCEPLELVSMAHRNVFSRLPIPSGDNVEATFPDELSEGLQVGTLLLLKKISSLISSEVYSGPLVPPLFVADITRVYRFSTELYRHINPAVCRLPLSWFCLHQYLTSRHSFHAPGEVKKTLELLAASFEKISPQGHLRPSEEFQEIPLFYFNWSTLPIEYKYHRGSLGPFQTINNSVETVLSRAELADTLGMRPEDIMNSSYENRDAKWKNSFGGQSLLALEEIAQYYTMSTFATTEAHQKALRDKDFRDYYLANKLGAEDHFKITPVFSYQSFENQSYFAAREVAYYDQVKSGKTPLSQRMVRFNNKKIEALFSDLPVQYVEEWQDQAPLLASLKKRSSEGEIYQLHQAAYGPFNLSLEVMLEYFEARPSLLYSRDYRSYFWALVRSAHGIETTVTSEPLFLDRLESFITLLYKEDRNKLEESALNFERALWSSALVRHMCSINESTLQKFRPLLVKIAGTLRSLAKRQPSNGLLKARLAPHLLASQQNLPSDLRLSLPELASLHLLVGRHPPSDPNDSMVWLEAIEAMQVQAPVIQKALMKGDPEIRRALWRLIFTSEAEVEAIMKRRPLSMSLEALRNISTQREQLLLKQAYHEYWMTSWKKYPWRSEAWLESATAIKLQKIKESLLPSEAAIEEAVGGLLKKAEELLIFTGTSLVAQMGGRLITVDWETGRLVGAGGHLPPGLNLPVYLRKHPNFAPLGQLLWRPLVKTLQGDKVQFQGNNEVTLDTCKGEAWLRHEGLEYRLVSHAELLSLNLPTPLQEGFTVWVKELKTEGIVGLVATHTKEGVPVPVFAIKSSGTIHPLRGDSSLSLASQGYYPEAQLFSRWGLSQSNILVWLDAKGAVVEMHIPLHNGESHFTRVSRTDRGSWKMDGLEVYLEATEESVAAFAGHPVYLVAKNSEGQRLLLLPGATPYELQKRREEQAYQVDWSQLLASGTKEGVKERAKERIHQYHIKASGLVEGLKVSDNLLLMLWTLYMGHYRETAALVKRWLTPAGRAYTEDEERLLLNWIRTESGKALMKGESHPSAHSLRLFVITRMKRHLRDFPPVRAQGEPPSQLWTNLLGPGYASNCSRNDISDHLINRTTLDRQVRGTRFEELFSVYDHEASLHLLSQEYLKSDNVLTRRLYQRFGGVPQNPQQGAIAISCRIHGLEIHSYNTDDINRSYFDELLEKFPTRPQTGIVPVDQIYRGLGWVNLFDFFDKAYTLVKLGDEENPEYKAVIHAIDQLRGPQALDSFFEGFNIELSHYYNLNSKALVLIWLLLEQALLAKRAGQTLPELPSIQYRFGLALQGSTEATKTFFLTLLELNKTSVEKVMQEFRKEWFAKRRLNYLEQQAQIAPLPVAFKDSLSAPWSKQLTSEMAYWSELSLPKEPLKQRELETSLEGWSYPTPPEWAETPATEEGLYNLEQKLALRLKIVSDLKVEREKKLLLSANALSKEKPLLDFARQIHYKTPLSVDECLGLALIGEECRWKESAPSVDPLELQRLVLLYLEIALEEAHLLRIKKELSLCQKDLEERDLWQQLLESIKTEHHYLPSTATLPLMVSEYYSDCRLRTQPDQAKLIKILTQESRIHRGSIIQAIMGSGKSKMLAPIWLQMMLGTGRIVIYCVPKSVIKTTLSDIQGMMWTRFKTYVRALNFDRERCSSDTLYGLAEALHIARFEPTVFVSTPGDLHALQLMLKERHQLVEEMRQRLVQFTLKGSETVLTEEAQRVFSSSLKNDDWKRAEEALCDREKEALGHWFKSHTKLEEELKPLVEESDLIQSILNLLQYQGALLSDEVATTYDPHNLQSFPIGWQAQANPHAAAMACKIYFEWLPDYFNKLDLLNNMQSLSDETERRGLYTLIAKRAWEEYSRKLPHFPSLNDFTAYLFSEGKKGVAAQKFVNELNSQKSVLKRQFAQELAFLKYCLTVGLEGAFTSTGHVNYGRSKQDPRLYLAIPYQCANVPKENTLFRRPWKTVLMTCQLYSQGWHDPHQTAELIAFLRGIDPASKDQEILEAAKVIWGRRFGDVEISDHEEMKRLTTDLDSARLQPELAKAARLLIRSFLQLCVFPVQLKLDPSQLTSTPQDIPMMTAKSDAMGGTFGFESTWNPKLARVPDPSCDSSILRALAERRNQTCHLLPTKGGAEALLSQFKAGAFKDYMALIDAGAHFKGLSNSTVAARLLEALKGFDSVLFYDEEQEGGARLAVMSSLGKTVLEHSDREGVRQALIQLKLSAPFAYYDQARCIGADLELKPGRALVTFSDTVGLDDLLQSSMRCRRLLEGRHSIAYVIPGQMGGTWTGDKVIQASRVHQNRREERANFHGVSEQLRGAVRSVIDREMRRMAHSEERHRFYKKVSGFFMEEQANDLVKTFGALHTKIDSHKALKQLSAQLADRVKGVLPNSFYNEVKNSLEAILKWHGERGTPLPKWVRDGEEQEEAIQEVNLSQDQDRMLLMEEEYERMLGTRNPKKESEWSRFDPQALSPSPMGSVGDHPDRPTLFVLREALKERGFTLPFSEHLLISGNLLFTFVGESNCLVTENQKPVHRGLLVRGDGEPTLILVSEGDARQLKKHLQALPELKGRGVYLVEPSGIINQRGCPDEKITHLWREGSLAERTLFVQALLFQGSAMVLDRLPKSEVAMVLNLWTKQNPQPLAQARHLFESALDFSPDDRQYYYRNLTLKKLLIN